MKVVDNVKVYGLEYSFKCSKYPMQVDTSKCNEEITPRINQLANTGIGEGHDNFMLGIVVQFDLTFTVKVWTEAERYHFFDIISSQSTMHRIARMDYDNCFIDFVTPAIKDEMKRLKDKYNQDMSKENYLTLLYNCPVGIKLTAGMTTNYRQLKIIYKQRRSHRLPEWQAFCDWVETLPHAELIIGDKRA